MPPAGFLSAPLPAAAFAPLPPLFPEPVVSVSVDVSVLVDVLLEPEIVIVTAPPVAAPVLRVAVAPPVLVLVPGVACAAAKSAGLADAGDVAESFFCIRFHKNISLVTSLKKNSRGARLELRPLDLRLAT